VEPALDLVDLAQPGAHRFHFSAQLIHLVLKRAQLARGLRVGAAAAKPARDRAADRRERKTDGSDHAEEGDGNEDFGTVNGGSIGSLGQPLKWHWQAGLSSGAYLEGPTKDLLVRGELGFSRGIRSSLTGLLELGGETYAGMRASRAETGFRAILRLPYFGMGAG